MISLRIVGNKQEIKVLSSLVKNDFWTYPAIIEMLRYSSLEISDDASFQINKPSIDSYGESHEVSLDEVSGLIKNRTLESLSFDEEKTVSDNGEDISDKTSLQNDESFKMAMSRLSSIGCVYEEDVATTEQGQRFEVFIQNKDETVEQFLSRFVLCAYKKESSVLLVARNYEDKGRLVRIAKVVFDLQVRNGKFWFVTSSDMPWGKGLIFSSLHLASAFYANDELEKAAALHYSARKQLLCKDDWLPNLKKTIADEIEEGVRNLGELPPDEQLDVAKDVVKKVASGDFSRADLGNAITVRKLIDMDILNPFEQHKVALTDKGVLLAKAWGAESVSKRPTPVDNIVLLVRTLLNGNSFERDVMILDEDVPICIRCARGNELREVVENDGMNHLFFALHDSAEPSEFEFLAKSYCDKVAAWRVSELRENSGLPRIAYRES